LDRNYKHYADIHFVPLNSQKAALQRVEQKDIYPDRIEVMKLISKLENSFKEREKKYGGRV
jgi:predicted metallo-beta-lactamase superfamily hydrolase